MTFTGKITMPQQTCGNCKHWEPPTSQYGEVPGTGKCSNTPEFWGVTEWLDDSDFCQLKPEYVGKKAFVQDGSDCRAVLKTLADFGCNQWEQV